MAAGVFKTAEAPHKDEAAPLAPPRPLPIGKEILHGVRVTLEARLGDATITVDELMALKSGAVVPLATGLSDHLDLYLNDTLVARGVIVAVGDKFGVKIVEVGSTS